MRVLQVTSYFAPAWAYGGETRVMTDFAAGLVARGHGGHGLHHRRPRRGDARPALARGGGGVGAERFPNLSNSLAWRMKKYLSPGLVLGDARRVRKFDVVHATDARTLATATACLRRRLAACRSRFRLTALCRALLGLRGAVKDMYDRALVRPMLGRAARCSLRPSMRSGSIVKRAEASPRFAGFHFRSTCRRSPIRSSPASCASARDSADDLPVVLFLGRIHQLKGLDVLVDAMQPLLEAGEAGLAVVGRDDGHWDEIVATARLLARRAGG